ncbi:hypothetical protein Tco_0436083 [Tanacetum coccineum]
MGQTNLRSVAEDATIPATFLVRDAGNLLTRAGFTLPGVDVDEYQVIIASRNVTNICDILGLVIYMTGWREHDSQKKAKRRGSATISFKDLQKEFGGQTH